MNQPWLTTNDWPVSAFDGNEAKKSATSATSSTVVNSPSTVSLSMTLLGNAQRVCLFRNLLVDQRRAHEAGADHVGANAVLGTFLGHDLGETDQAMLGRYIRCLEHGCLLG